MPCNRKCKCMTIPIQMTLWCFDVLKFLQYHDPDVFYFRIEEIILAKAKLAELEKIVFLDLNIDEKKKDGFKLKDCRCIFKQLDEIMNNLSCYSLPLYKVWNTIRLHPQWFSYVNTE